MRTSPIYYISPRHISLTPNCNGSDNDIAVDIQQGAKLKVYAPGVERLGMNPNTNTFREWTLEGRNRTLKGGDGPYTIYARLPKSDFYITPGNAYLVFAAQRQYGSGNEYGLAGQWFDRYSYVTDGGLAPQYDERGFPKVVDDPNFWWVKLGTVSPVTNGMRTIDLDTGILGTEQWNAEWQQKPDELPLRIDLSTKVAGKELGSNPYVRWGQTLLLTASLVKGFDADAETTVERWTISRNTGNAASDEEWNSVTDPETEEQTAKTMSNGTISLSHLRVTDDFAGAVAAIFTVTAWGTAEAEETEEEETEEEEETLVPLAVATITISAETQERYEVVLSTGVMSRNPNDGHYSPDDGVGVRVRCTDQRGITEYLTRQRFSNASLAVEYRQVGSESPAWTRLSLDASSTDAFTVVPTSAFANDNNVDVRLVRTTTSEPYTVLAEFDMKTVAFVRNGEDSGSREWIYYRSAGRVVFGTSNPPLLPSAIAEGQVAPAGAASGTDTDKSQAGWVPNGWFDNPPELNSEYKFIYESYRDSEGTGWGEFARPRIYDSTDLDGGTPEFRYQWNQSPTTCPSYAANAQNPGEGWSVNVPNRPADGYYLWAISALHYADHYGPWGNPIRMTGDSGTPGEDSKEREWIYIGKSEATTFSGNALPANITTDNNGIQRTAAYIAETDDFVPLGWSDTAIAIDDSNNRFVYESWRVWDGAQGKWGAFQAPVLRSNWGRQGVDGDGVQYVFKLFANELTEQQCESSSFIPDVPASPNEQGEYIPSGTGKNADWSDDPLSPTAAMPFCYCSAIKRIGGSWGSFGRLGLWAAYAESGLTADIDNELDAFGTDIDGLVITQQIRTTKLQLFYGINPQTITAITAAVYRADTNAQVSDSNIIEVSHSGLNSTQATIDVTVKAQATITYDVYVDITATCGIGTRTVRFTLKHVASGAPGVNPTLYQLLPSATSIAFKKNAAGNGYTQQQQTITCGITESNGNTTTPHPDSTSLGGYRVYYRKSSDTNFTQLTSAGVTVQATEQTSFVEFVLRAGNAAFFSADTTSGIVDRETIPVLKDGLDGEQGPEGKAAAKAVFSPSVIFVDADAEGNSIGEQVFLVSCHVEVEGNNAGYEQLTIGTTPSGITAVYNSSTRKVVVTVPNNVAALNYEGEVVVAMTTSFGGREYAGAGSIPIVAKRRGESVQGDDGDDGYGLALTPSVLIFNEKLDINRSPYVDYSNNTVTAVVFKGSTPLTPVVSKLTTASSYSGCELSGITVSGGTVTMGSGSIGSGVTEGFFTVNIKADGGNYDQDVRINFYVNRFGSWEVTVENGISTEVGRQIAYGLQEGGVIKTAYSADIEKSAQGLTQQFTEQISRASADSRNLFGFCKGVVFDHSIPFIQGYGMIGRPWEGSDLTARVFNLGMYGRLGYYTVSCLVKMSTSAGYVRLQMNWHQAVSGTRAVTDGVVGTVYATTTGWKRITATFLFDEPSENHIGTSLNEGQAGSFSAGDINGYIDIGQITSGTDETKIAASGNMIFVRHLKVEYKDAYSDFCEADEDIACLGQRSMVTAAPDDFTPGGPAGSRSYAAENTYGGVTVENVYSVAYNNGSSAYNDTWSQFLTYPIATRQLAAGKVYTLSFWARATQAGLALSSVLRLSATGTKPFSNNGSIVSPSVEKVYVGGNGFVTEGVSQNGMTEVRLTTAWKQYFVYYYAASSAYLYELVAATIYGGSNQGKSCTVYIGGVQLQEGYVMAASYFSSLIEQNARRISLVQQSGSKLTGIDMQNGTIDIFADKFRLKNTDGQQTLGVNKNGDLEVLGVIRAKNLYRMVAFAWGQGSSSSNYSIASIKNSDMDECYYVGSLDGLTADYKTLFTPGEYVMLSEIKRRTDEYYSSAPTGFDICTGYADYIVIVDNGSNVTRHTTVCLPRAADLEGKVIEIVNRSNSDGSDKVRVKQVGTYGYHFVMGFYASGIAGAAGQESFELSRGERCTLVAASSRWVVV